MTGFILCRTDNVRRKYVAGPGRVQAYTANRNAARIYTSEKAAEEYRCSNEVIEPL